MAYYLFQVAYAPEAVAAMIKNPQNRMELTQPVMEKLGGRIVDMWLAFGEYDAVVIIELPDNVSVVAAVMAGSASGAFKTAKTTPLMTMEEGIKAMKMAGEAGYQPPSG